VGRKRYPTEWSAAGAIDSHAHLERGTYGEELGAVLERAWAHDVSAIVLISASDDPAVFAETAALAATDKRLSMVAGIHPHCARHHKNLLPALNELLGLDDLVAIGEIGLDYHYDFSPREEQQSVFRSQLALARDHELPVVLHLREALDDALTILDEFGPRHHGIVHCFTGTSEEAALFLSRGLHISIPGIITFGRGAQPIRDAVAAIPLDRLLVETDSPYLSPHPFRGRRNEPAMVAFVLEEVARCKGISVAEAASATRENTRRVFAL
jgi:TatD DNase family protein